MWKFNKLLCTHHVLGRLVYTLWMSGALIRAGTGTDTLWYRTSNKHKGRDPHVSPQDHSSRTGFSLEDIKAHSPGNRRDWRAGELTQHLPGFLSSPGDKTAVVNISDPFPIEMVKQEAFREE